MFAPCTCKNEYMDRMYGKGVRVFTEHNKTPPTCVVCGPKAGIERKCASIAMNHKPIHG